MSVNKVILIGNVGQYPEVKEVGSGNKVAKFSLATTEKYTKNGEKVETTEWHNIEMWDRQAEIVEQYVKKGDKLYLEGKIKTDKWEAEDGTNRYSTKINCFHMQMLGGKSDGQAAPAPAPASAPDTKDDLPFD